MRENRAMVKRLGLRKHSVSSFQTYPPIGTAAAGIQLPIGQGTHIWGNVLRCYARRGPARAGPLTVPPVKLRPSLPIATTIWSSGSSQGAALTSHTWMWPSVDVSLFNNVFQTCFLASFPGFLPLFLEISILRGISLSCCSRPLSTSQLAADAFVAALGTVPAGGRDSRDQTVAQQSGRECVKSQDPGDSRFRSGRRHSKLIHRDYLLRLW
jgi:hypothetical protein